jgi:hypothetical protein
VSLLLALERVADQVERRRPETDEQRAPFRVPPLLLVNRLGPNPQDYAEADGRERSDVEVPASQSG